MQKRIEWNSNKKRHIASIMWTTKAEFDPFYFNC